MSKQDVIQIENLTVNYGKNLVLWEVFLSISSGKMIGIIGPNGAGKSTFLKALMGFCPKLSGKITFWQKAFSSVRTKIAYIPQKEEIDWDFPITVYEVVLMGRFSHLRFWQRPKAFDKQKVFDALEKVGLKEYAKRQIGQLSGGQQQKLFLARAIAQEAKVYLLDEPFQGVDATSEKVIIQVLKQWRNEGKTILIVHHDLSRLKEYFDELVFLNKRIIASGPLEQVLTEENLQAVFGNSPMLFEEASRLQVATMGVL